MDNRIDAITINNGYSSCLNPTNSQMILSLDKNKLSVMQVDRKKMKSYYIFDPIISITSKSIFIIDFFKSLLSFNKLENIKKSIRRDASTIRLFIFIMAIFIISQLLPMSDASEPLRNPYEILGVSRRATLQDIRKAYKNLVKEW